MTSVLVTHPSADRYGSDLQLLETVSAFVEAGHRVTVLLPGPGPLAPMLTARGGQVEYVDFPVLRKSMLSVRGLLGLLATTLRTAPTLWRTLRTHRPDVVWVNTITTPVWFLLGRVTGTRTVAHVHEAESDGPRWARWGLTVPVALAHRIVTNSRAAAEALLDVVPGLGARITVVHNGMPGPPSAPVPPRARQPRDPAHLVLVARLSPRKGIDVALDAVGLLRSEGREVTLTIGGTVFEGYEWFEDECRARATRADLAGAVTFAGYVSPTWPLVAEADVVLVPSRVEPFGNTAVEALLAARPVVASRTQGLREIVDDGRTGLLVTPDDPAALAEAVGRLLDDPPAAADMARQGRLDALDRFSPATYAAAVTGVLTAASGSARR